MANQLQWEKSPYLLQHSENPVDWYPWGAEAFQKAKEEDKPVFLSIGYSTCHWCHVMAQESFADLEVAEVLNKAFVCVKVDREERPDIDAVYMQVCQVMTGSGGWPLTVMLTPEQQPFFAGTYFPKYRQYGQPGLLHILKTTAQLWQQQREELLHTGKELTALLKPISTGLQKEPSVDLLHRAYKQYRQQFDSAWGGFGQAPKFPTPHHILFLAAYSKWAGEPEALSMAETTLQAMARGGIHDQIGGGFSRYSTDRYWLVPHFEKMLYDNALLILAYLHLYQETKNSDYACIVERTVNYILRKLKDHLGGFYCGQDADSDGIEGKYYVFTPEETTMVLGQQNGVLFNKAYNITKEGNFEQGSIPNRINQIEAPWPEDDWRLQALYQYRLKRTVLHKDDKVLTSWNGWAIIALARAGLVLDRQQYLQAAQQCQQFIEQFMTDGAGRLYVRWRDGEAAHAGQLDDYAVYGLALLELYKRTFQPYYLRQAIVYAEQILEHFVDATSGGFFLTADDAEQLIVRPKETYDRALPSGNSAAACLLQQLGWFTGEPKWKQAAWQQLQFVAGAAEQHPVGHGFSLWTLLEGLSPHKVLICVSREETLPSELRQYLQEHSADHITVLFKNAAVSVELAHCVPFTANYPLPDEGVVYYLCENGACRRPILQFAQLEKQLSVETK